MRARLAVISVLGLGILITGAAPGEAADCDRYGTPFQQQFAINSGGKFFFQSIPVATNVSIVIDQISGQFHRTIPAEVPADFQLNLLVTTVVGGQTADHNLPIQVLPFSKSSDLNTAFWIFLLRDLDIPADAGTNIALLLDSNDNTAVGELTVSGFLCKRPVVPPFFRPFPQ